MKKPQCVIDYDSALKLYKKGEISKPKMLPPIIEYKQYSNIFYRLQNAVTHKDRNVKTKDIKALTEEITWHIKQTHNLNNHVVFFLKKESEYFENEVYRAQASCNVSALTPYKISKIMTLAKTVNTYITSLDFIYSNNKRTSDLAYSVRALQIDIDYYSVDKLKKCSAEDVYKKIYNYMSKKYNNKLLPAYTVSSGNGLYIVIPINDFVVYNNDNNKRLYTKIMSKIISDLKQFGADMSCKDLSRVLRLPSTYNLKNNEKKLTYIINFDKIKNKPITRYDIKDIQQILAIKDDNIKNSIVYISKHKKRNRLQKTTHNTTKKCKLSLNSLGQARVYDLMRYLYNRHGDIEKRHLFLMYISVAYIEYNTSLSLHNFLTDTNNKLLDKLSDSEIVRIYKTVLQSALERNGLSTSDINKYIDYDDYLPQNKKSATYKYDKLIYSNDVIISNLEMTDNEIKNNKTIITKKEKNKRKKAANKAKRRNNNGLTKKQQEIEDKLIIISNMLQKNKDKKDIMQTLNISKCTFFRYIKKLKSA